MQQSSLWCPLLLLAFKTGCFFLLVESFSPAVVSTARFDFNKSPYLKNSRINNNRLCSSANENDNEDLLERARALREEAQQIEQQLRKSNKDTKLTSTQESERPSPKKIVTKLEDSVWTLSYRFSSQPKDDDKENDNDLILPNYSGKITVRLKPDGYSELLSSSSISFQESSRLQIVKVWGWDEEYSQEDQQQYLLFSVDVRMPPSDPKLPNRTERYYFQARIDKENENNKPAILLRDGTVTVKKDVAEKTKGMWGLFQVAGILTQFRYVGDFVARPSEDV